MKSRVSHEKVYTSTRVGGFLAFCICITLFVISAYSRQMNRGEVLQKTFCGRSIIAPLAVVAVRVPASRLFISGLKRAVFRILVISALVGFPASRCFKPMDWNSRCQATASIRVNEEGALSLLEGDRKNRSGGWSRVATDCQFPIDAAF